MTDISPKSSAENNNIVTSSKDEEVEARSSTSIKSDIFGMRDSLESPNSPDTQNGRAKKIVDILHKNSVKNFEIDVSSEDKSELISSNEDDIHDYHDHFQRLFDVNTLESQSHSNDQSEIMCEIHCDTVPLVPTRCCQFNVCDECILSHIRVKLSESSQLVKIQCVNCAQIIPRLDVINRLKMSREDGDTKVLDDFMRRIILRDTHGAKECPQCSHVTLNKAKSILKRVEKGRNSIFYEKSGIYRLFFFLFTYFKG